MSWKQRSVLLSILLVCFGIVGGICWWGAQAPKHQPDKQLDALEPTRSDIPRGQASSSDSRDASTDSDSLLGEVMSDAGGRVKVRRGTWNPLPEECQELLSTYQQQENCLLVHAGYLDLLGRTWGCVIRGIDWAEVGIVREAVGATEGEVLVMRFEPKDVSEETLRVLQAELNTAETSHGVSE